MKHYITSTFRHDKRLIILYFYSILLVFSITLGSYISTEKVWYYNKFSSVYSLKLLFASMLVSIPLSIIFKKCIDFCVGKYNKCDTNGIGGGGRSALIIFIGFIIFALPAFLAFYPAIFSYDITTQWEQYITKHYTTWHPIAHTFLFGLLCDIGNVLLGDYNKGLALYSIVQILIVSVSLTNAFIFSCGLRLSGKIKIFLYLLYLLFPVIYLMEMASTKDTIFGALFLLCFIALCKFIKRNKNVGSTKILFVVMMICMSCFRNNSVYGLILMMGVLGIISLCFKEKSKDRATYIRSIVYVTIGVACSIGMLKAIQFGANGAVLDNKREKFSLPSQQIARVYRYHYMELEKDDVKRIEEYYNEGIKEYKPFIADPTKGSWNEFYYEKNPFDYYKLWLELGIKYPKDYVLAFLLNAKGIWHITDKSHSEIKGGYVEMGFSPPIDEEHDVWEHSLWPEMQKIYYDFSYMKKYQDIPVLSLLFSPALYVWITGGSIAVALYKKKYILIIPGLFILCYCVTLLLGPCIIIRYCFPFIITTPFYTLFVVSECREKI